jgi:hypothetical protein
MMSAATFLPAKLTVDASGARQTLVNFGPARTAADNASVVPAVQNAVRDIVFSVGSKEGPP